MKQTAICLIFALSTLPVCAEPSLEELATKLEVQQNETLGAFYDRIVAEWVSSDALKTDVADRATDRASKITGNQPSIAGASTGFGTRVGETLTNFQPTFAFAVNAITTADDDKSVTIEYNPIRIGKFGAIKISTTISEPQPASDLLGQIVEGARESQKETLQKTLDDFDDITTSLTYGFQRSSGDDWQKQPRLWGRNPKLYDGFAKALLEEAWKATPIRDDDPFWHRLHETLSAHEATRKLADEDLYGLTFDQVKEVNVSLEEVKRWLIDDAIRFAHRNLLFAENSIPELGNLIDDQPTFTVTAAYENQDDFVGRDSFSATVKFEKGRLNINRVRSEKDAQGGLLQAYRHVVKERETKAKDRLTFVLNYKWLDERALTYAYTQSLTDPTTGGINEFPREASVSMEKSEEFTARFTYSYSLKRQARTIDGEKIYPRLDFSVLYTNPISDDLRDERVLAQLAYHLPILEGMSLPVTLSYSSDPDFLGEQDTGFSARLGLNYGLSRLFEKKGKEKTQP